jgi:hypothetical protein
MLIAKRMDLFDTTAYFSSKVPVIAASKPLLKYAVCALAAKHLHHYCRVRKAAQYSPLIPDCCLSGPRGELDWRYYSIHYYHQALGHLKASIASSTLQHGRFEQEELFAAVAILCTYELMDAPGTAWRAHLSALPLFSQGGAFASAPSEIIIPSTTIKGPVFWSLARQDLLCTCKIMIALLVAKTETNFCSYV